MHFGLLDNLKDTTLEVDLPLELFATSFNTEMPPKEPEIDEFGEPVAPKNLEPFFLVKTFKCPICNTEFQGKVPRETKMRLDTTIELRPVYYDIEPLCFDAAMCVVCGYASLRTKFETLTDKQVDAIRANIRPNYVQFMPPSYPIELDHKMGIERYKFALLNACIKKASHGEKGYIMMKISWLYQILGDTENEVRFAKTAYESFAKAYTAERFPIFGLSEGTLTYLLGNFAFKKGDYSMALRHIANIIVNKDMPARLRDLARELKDKITEARGGDSSDE
ncbi:MAG: DUF2225 domain-containing protein [Defluviitaleaceae bacterium]|nr:DUF2225 domain-containing protein [Defluviitaleaceae bacterium]